MKQHQCRVQDLQPAADLNTCARVSAHLVEADQRVWPLAGLLLAPQMKLFQAALQHRKSITITTDESKALDEECVVVASSLTMLEFIANMLPVSLRCVGPLWL